MKFIIDLDNTLVLSDEANNIAYNAALRLEGIDPLPLSGRITRSVVLKTYPKLTGEQMDRIIANKNRLYPVHETRLNHDLVEYIKMQGKNACLLWSSANEKRILSILDYHKLRSLFFDIFISAKSDIIKDLEVLVNRYAMTYQELIVFEDTDRYIAELREKGIRVVDIKQWKPQKGQFHECDPIFKLFS